MDFVISLLRRSLHWNPPPSGICIFSSQQGRRLDCCQPSRRCPNNLFGTSDVLIRPFSLISAYQHCPGPSPPSYTIAVLLSPSNDQLKAQADLRHLFPYSRCRSFLKSKLPPRKWTKPLSPFFAPSISTLISWLLLPSFFFAPCC